YPALASTITKTQEIGGQVCTPVPQYCLKHRPPLADVPKLAGMVSSESVAKACSEVGEYSDQQMVGEFDRFFRAQPAVCDFVVESTHESGQKVQELSLFLSYMILKAAETDTSRSVTQLSPEPSRPVTAKRSCGWSASAR